MDFERQLKELEKQIAEVAGSLNTAFEKIALSMAEASEALRAPMLVMAEAVQRLPDDLRAVIEALARRGWYISAEMELPLIRAIQTAAEAGDLPQVDQLMETWTSSHIRDIEVHAVSLFPDRAGIITAAMRAHDAGQFELSIPVLLIQVDGMCIEKFKTNFYSTKRGVPVIKELVESSMVDGPVTDVFLLPLRQPSGLTASSLYRATYPDALNRHEILHGISTAYPSRINSLKAVSLLEYFVSLVVGK